MRVLLVCLGGLGAVVHAMPAVHDIRAARPDAVVDWVAEPAFAPLLRRVHGTASVFDCAATRWRDAWWSGATRKGIAALRAALARAPYDAVLDLTGSVASALVARLAAGHRFGYANRTEGDDWDALAGVLVRYPVRMPARIHGVDKVRALVGAMLRVAPQGPPVHGLHAAHPYAPADRPTVVFAHGSRHDARLWPVAQWVALGKRLLDAGWRIALPHADEVELTRAELIAAQLQVHKMPLVEIWPALPVDRVLDRLAGAQGVIGVAGGLSQVALALGLPTVQIHAQPTAWRSGPLAAHGRRRQLAVEGTGGRAPALDAVWSAWQHVAVDAE